MLQQCPITQGFSYIQQKKNVSISQAVDSDLKWSELLCEEACFNTLTRSLEVYELRKKTRPLMHSKPIGSHS